MDKDREAFELHMTGVFPHVSLEGVDSSNGFIYRSPEASNAYIVWRACATYYHALLEQMAEDLNRALKDNAGGDYGLQFDVEQVLAAYSAAMGEK